ncbi:MAG: hypothetical protein JWR15_2837, partial [Prosthecobacter sp.]|nr:hypothetical protein [Prosthecobacter sp.]
CYVCKQTAFGGLLKLWVKMHTSTEDAEPEACRFPHLV